jgi:hypothetical protein
VRRADTLRVAASLLIGAAGGLDSRPALARPNTHAPAISTWDTRASSVVLALGRGVSGGADFTRVSYNANFSSTSGVLSAQFGVHYLTYRDQQDSVLARGFSAGGVALFNFPVAERFANGVPRASFDFYVGGVPTALFSGQLNFISVPLVLGVGVPLSPTPWLTVEPWVELSPGVNFDTRIQEVSTAAAVQSAMDGTLTRDEVADLVEEGLQITQQTSVGKRAGLSLTGHLGERVDLGVHLALGAGHSGAASLGAGLVVRWDALVTSARSGSTPPPPEPRVPEACAAWQTGLQRCVAAQPAPAAAQPRSAAPAAPPSSPRGTRAGARRAPRATPQSVTPPPAAVAPAAAPAAPRKKAAPPAPQAPAAPAAPPRPAVDALPPLQAAPPRPR